MPRGQEREASYVVCPEKTFFVTTIYWENPGAPSFNGYESGIRDMSKHWDGRAYADYKEHSQVISFTLCRHDIGPMKRGHKAVIDSLKRGIAPEAVYDSLHYQEAP